MPLRNSSFNPKLVQLEADGGSGQQNTPQVFQSQTGSIRGRLKLAGTLFALKCFNPKLVQLEEEIINAYNKTLK